ncbi:family 16 glycosylhydrolase [Phenylobacterium montanum]|uniref:Family 16 glycosylhydrolase n=1 Tax=Phenylobacterium montanum TaxID=2823693 RepID=A0A975FYV5_9CAUL|nr:family 16 glycosylhydrolase [Caulobacter sp. S6]QUD87457.1 family 16 glycosylhydrolase [Caulobacter sp. S6]
MTTYLDFNGLSTPLSAAPTYWAYTTTVGQTLTGVNQPEQLRDSLGGSPTLVGGAADTTFSVISPTTNIVAQAGFINTVVAYHNFILPANVQNLTLAGASSTGTGNSMNDLIIAQGQGDTVIAGTGNDVMVDAGAGKDLFTFNTGFAKDVIYGFQVTGTNADRIVFTDPNYASFAQIQSHLTQQGSDVLLTLSSTSQILIKGVSLSSLTASNFGLPHPATGYVDFNGNAMLGSMAPTYWANTTTVGQTLTGVDQAESLRDSLGGSPTLVAGKGDTTFSVISPTTTVVGQAGFINTVVAYHSFVLPSNVQNLTLAGASSTGTGNSLSNLIIAQGAGDTIVAGTGNDVLVDAGAGHDLFTFNPGFAKDVVYGFQVSGTAADRIVLTDPNFASFAQIQSHLTQQGSDTLLTLSSTSQILIKGVSATSLTAANFGLAQPMTSYQDINGHAMAGSMAPVYWANTTTLGQTLTGLNEPESLRDSLGGSPTLIGGKGDTTFSVISPTTAVTAQSGYVNTVVAYRGFTLPANVQNLTVVDDHSTGVGNSLNNLIIAQGLNDAIDGGMGNDVLVDAGGGQSVFTFDPGFGQDVLYGFKVSGTNADKIVLTDPSITSFAQVQSHLTQVGSDTLLTLSSGSEILLKGVTATSLTASDFGLHLDMTGMTETFAGDFSSGLSLYNASTGAGTWKSNFAFGVQSGTGDWASRTEVGNSELQLYVDPSYKGSGTTALGINPFSVSNGILDIHATATPTADVTYLNGYHYTSGLLTTEKSFSQLYGYFEIKAQLPNTPGAWPAFWMLPTNPTSAAEIDVLEDFGGSPIHQTVIHGATGSPSQTYFVNTVPTDGTAFHTYGVLWTSHEIDFYIDGVNVGSTPTPSDLNTPMYMLTNLAVGGISGTPGAGFSADMQIAYIHAYSLSNLASSTAPTAVKAAAAAQTSLASPTTATAAATTSTTTTTEHATATTVAQPVHLIGDAHASLDFSSLGLGGHEVGFGAHMHEHWA